MKRLILIVCIAFGYATRAQTTETFETETDNATFFESAGKTFNLSGVFHIENLQDYGLGPSNFYVDNSNSCGTPGVTGIIKTSDGYDVKLNSLWIFVSTTCEFAASGNIQITWYKDGAQVTSGIYPITSQINTDNGFVKIDFDANGQSSFEADEWRFQAVAPLNYMAIDDFQWTDPALGIDGVDFGSSVSYYPNPVEDILNLHLDEQYASLKIQVSNALGQLIDEYKSGSGDTVQLPFDYAQGMYFVKLETNSGQSSVLKIMKE